MYSRYRLDVSTYKLGDLTNKPLFAVGMDRPNIELSGRGTASPAVTRMAWAIRAPDERPGPAAHLAFCEKKGLRICIQVQLAASSAA